MKFAAYSQDGTWLGDVHCESEDSLEALKEIRQTMPEVASLTPVSVNDQREKL